MRLAAIVDGPYQLRIGVGVAVANMDVTALEIDEEIRENEKHQHYCAGK